MSRLEDAVCAVVGAGQQRGATIGNGRATAIRFAEEGARLVLVDRDADAVEATLDAVAEMGVEAVPLVVDVTDAGAPERVIAAAVEHFGRLDVLQNNVGIGAGDRPPHRLDEDVFDRIVEVNLKATWRLCKVAIPTMREQQRGAITNVSSIASIAGTQIAAYRMSKAGVDALTRNVAVTNAAHGIRCNAVLPGLIDTPIGVDAAAAALGVDRDEYAAKRAAQVPMRRQGTAWDVANASLFLASDEAAFITGVCLPVDGGQTARIG